MPSLPPSGFVDEDIDDVLDGGIDAALSSNLAQREQSTTTETATIECILADEVESAVEQKHDSDQAGDEEDEETSFKYLLWDAMDNHRGKKPDFVMTGIKLETTKLVDMGEGQTAEMTFTAWDKLKRQGYWVLEDNYGHKHIVKFFKKGKCYREWLGTGEGFNEEPFAWPERIRRTPRSSTVEDDIVAIEEDDESSDAAQIGNRNLRKKTWTQKHPYAVDKEVHAATRQGKIKRTADIDAREAKRDKSLKRSRSSMTPAIPRHTSRTTQKKQQRSRSTTTNFSDRPELTSEDFQAHVNAKTSLLTKLPPDDEPLPIFLLECPDVTALWDKVVSMWASDIEGTVKSMSIRFPWLGPEYNIKLKAGLSGPYDKMIEEVRDAPCWKDGTDKCSVDILLIVA